MESPIFLVGLPGAGKTTIGQILAQEYGVDHKDSDHFLEQKYARPCGEIFQDLGEQQFREQEAEAVKTLARQAGVVSLGGGAVEHLGTQAVLLEHKPRVVYLFMTPEEGLKRTDKDTSRPLLNVEDPKAQYSKLFNQRDPLYRNSAAMVVNTVGRTPDEIVQEIMTNFQGEAL